MKLDNDSHSLKSILDKWRNCNVKDLDDRDPDDDQDSSGRRERACHVPQIQQTFKVLNYWLRHSLKSFVYKIWSLRLEV